MIRTGEKDGGIEKGKKIKIRESDEAINIGGRNYGEREREGEEKGTREER